MRKLGSLITLLVVLAILVGGGIYLSRNRDGISFGGGVVKDSGENISDYSAIFLTNGQVYFGKLVSMDNTELDLRDIFYLQVNQEVQGANADESATDPELSLVKLGNELHGPNDRMRINRDHVLFTESLKKDARVVKAIEEFKAQ